MRNLQYDDTLNRALKMVGKKYDLLIIESINSNKNRVHFNELIKAIPSINPRILSMRLKSLEQTKLITKSILIGTPVQTVYSLTDRAEELIEIIEMLKEWVKKS